ncbi:hypothetical protein GN156_16785 [bacterium LRH843]|nr:hypothetical protein [bacterium LRH843]
MLPRIVIGSIGVVITYITIFFIAQATEGASIILPAEILYFFLLYGFLGCLVFIFVFPVILIVKGRKEGMNNKS